MSKKIEKLSRKINGLVSRIEKIEKTIVSGKNEKISGLPLGFCSMPEVVERKFDSNVSTDRERLIRYINKKWVNGTKLRYYFYSDNQFGGESDQVNLVRQAFNVWKGVGIGVSFDEVQDISEAEIRIGFLQDGSAWSYVGRDVIDIPGQHERTMNFGWNLVLDPRGVDTPVHEIGHTLGFPHEHQNPFSGIVWDEEAVYEYFAGDPNHWSRETTFHNVLRKLQKNTIEGSKWDPDSIMHYGFPAGLIVKPDEYQSGLTPQLGLTNYDREEVRKFYPIIDDSKNVILERYKPKMLTLLPAEQKNFTIEPNATDDYAIQTFGHSDTLIVLFEEVNGELRFLEGDDDSGTSLNASLQTHLRRGRRYVLRVRMYSSYATGDTAVMMW